MHENLQRKRYPDGMHFLRIVVADRFPKAQAAAIISDTVTAVLGRSAIAREHFKIEYADISQDRDALNRGMVGLNRESWWRKYLEDRHGVHEHALGIQISTDSFLMAVIESDQPDNVAEGIYGQLRAGMVDQLTGTRPGIVHAHLLDITRPQLESLQAAGSALDAIANRLMNRSEKRPLGVMYSATSQAISRDDRGDGVRLSLPGLSYSFVDPAHPLAEDPRVKAAFGSEIPWDERTSRPVA
jgi:hypothetical protein